MLRRAITLLVLLASIGSTIRADADDGVNFAAAIQAIMANLRSAANYVRTGNVALAAIEIADAKAAWPRLHSFADQPPPRYQAPAFRIFITSGGNRLAAADQALEAGDTVKSAAELLALRQSFRDLRRAADIYELGDCVFALAPAMEALRVAATDFNEVRGSSGEVNVAAAKFRDHLARCNRLAPPDIAGEGEFRRLIDGAIASAGEIGHAAAAGDTSLMHRYLIELQSFAHLLDFRYG